MTDYSAKIQMALRMQSVNQVSLFSLIYKLHHHPVHAKAKSKYATI